MAETDETIYYRFLSAGDSRDLSALLERHKESLTLFIYSIIHDLGDAEELMLDSFAVVAGGRNPFAAQSSFRTWLFSIGKRLALQQLRKKKLPAELIDETLADNRTPDLQILQDERKRVLYDALGSLSPDYRQVLILLYFEDMSYEEAGRVMRKTRRQMYNLAERGKKALKENLEKMGYDR
jgi:RNA polymerase sigma-70 factor (ECF subfamily)